MSSSLSTRSIAAAVSLIAIAFSTAVFAQSGDIGWVRVNPSLSPRSGHSLQSLAIPFPNGVTVEDVRRSAASHFQSGVLWTVPTEVLVMFGGQSNDMLISFDVGQTWVTALSHSTLKRTRFVSFVPPNSNSIVMTSGVMEAATHPSIGDVKGDVLFNDVWRIDIWMNISTSIDAAIDWNKLVKDRDSRIEKDPLQAFSQIVVSLPIQFTITQLSNNAAFAPRLDAAAACVSNITSPYNGFCYLMGGGTARDLSYPTPFYTTVADVYRSTDGGVSWALLTSRADWWHRRGHSITYFNGMFYLFGGYQIQTVSNIRSRLIHTWFGDLWTSNDAVSWRLLSLSHRFDSSRRSASGVAFIGHSPIQLSPSSLLLGVGGATFLYTYQFAFSTSPMVLTNTEAYIPPLTATPNFFFPYDPTGLSIGDPTHCTPGSGAFGARLPMSPYGNPDVRYAGGSTASDFVIIDQSNALMRLLTMSVYSPYPAPNGVRVLCRLLNVDNGTALAAACSANITGASGDSFAGYSFGPFYEYSGQELSYVDYNTGQPHRTICLSSFEPRVTDANHISWDVSLPNNLESPKSVQSGLVTFDDHQTLRCAFDILQPCAERDEWIVVSKMLNHRSAGCVMAVDWQRTLHPTILQDRNAADTYDYSYYPVVINCPAAPSAPNTIYQLADRMILSGVSGDAVVTPPQTIPATPPDNTNNTINGRYLSAGTQLHFSNRTYVLASGGITLAATNPADGWAYQSLMTDEIRVYGFMPDYCSMARAAHINVCNTSSDNFISICQNQPTGIKCVDVPRPATNQTSLNENNNGGANKLSGVAIAMIILSIIIFLVLVCAGVRYWKRRQKAATAEERQPISPHRQKRELTTPPDQKKSAANPASSSAASSSSSSSSSSAAAASSSAMASAPGLSGLASLPDQMPQLPDPWLAGSSAASSSSSVVPTNAPPPSRHESSSRRSNAFKSQRDSRPKQAPRPTSSSMVASSAAMSAAMSLSATRSSSIASYQPSINADDPNPSVPVTSGTTRSNFSSHGAPPISRKQTIAPPPVPPPPPSFSPTPPPPPIDSV